MKNPRKCLPEFFNLVDSLAHQIEIEALKNWDEFEPQVREFFTSEQMGKVEKFVAGWKRMASYADGVTLIHVASALVGLVQLPEYRSAARAEQEIMEWIILFHDVGKQVPPDGGRDAVHAFRSAVLTAHGLKSNGFVQVDEGGLVEWCSLTQSAIKVDERTGQEFQDNGRLNSICAGIENLFGRDSPASLILKSILFHLSIDVVADWPQPAALDDLSIRKYFNARLFPYMKVMMLVDSEAWSLFDSDTKIKYRQETLAVFERISILINS
jgi:hypothetical protein